MILIMFRNMILIIIILLIHNNLHTERIFKALNDIVSFKSMSTVYMLLSLEDTKFSRTYL